MAYAEVSTERTAFECLTVWYAWGYQKPCLSSCMAPSDFNLRYVFVCTRDR